MFISVVVLVPAASAAVGPLGPAPVDARRRQATRRRAIEREAAQPDPAPRSGARERKARPAFVVPPHLEAIAQCESGGDPRAIGGGGAYRGKYQFSYSTWAGVGGTGDPAAAPEAEQDRRAAMLYAAAARASGPCAAASAVRGAA